MLTPTSKIQEYLLGSYNKFYNVIDNDENIELSDWQMSHGSYFILLTVYTMIHSTNIVIPSDKLYVATTYEVATDGKTKKKVI